MNKRGFTIVEIMIVIAVSGFLFAAAVLALNGREVNTNFSVAANSLQSELQKIVNYPKEGYYPYNSNSTCSVSGTSISFSKSTISSSQGTNQDCIYLGEIIDFNTANQLFSVYEIVGNNCIGPIPTFPCQTQVTSYASASSLSTTDQSLTINYSNELNLQTSGSILPIAITNNSSTSSSGSQGVQLDKINTPVNTKQPLSAAADFTPIQSYLLCFAGPNNRFAVYNIEQGSGSVVVNLNLKSSC